MEQIRLSPMYTSGLLQWWGRTFQKLDQIGLSPWSFFSLCLCVQNRFKVTTLIEDGCILTSTVRVNSSIKRSREGLTTTRHLDDSISWGVHERIVTTHSLDIYFGPSVNFQKTHFPHYMYTSQQVEETPPPESIVTVHYDQPFCRTI